MEFADLPGRRSADPLAATPAASSVRVVELGRSDRRTAHRHPLSEEIVYVESGEGRVWIDGTLQEVGPGDLIRIPAGAAHATIPAEAGEMRLICYFPHPVLNDNIIDTDIDVMEDHQ